MLKRIVLGAVIIILFIVLAVGVHSFLEYEKFSQSSIHLGTSDFVIYGAIAPPFFKNQDEYLKRIQKDCNKKRGIFNNQVASFDDKGNVITECSSCLGDACFNKGCVNKELICRIK